MKNSIAQVVADDLCIGCGLCESVTGGRVTMAMTPAGSLRPSQTSTFTAEEETTLLQVCPGVVAEARPDPAWNSRQPDPIWGTHGTITRAWAANPEVRFQAATGGVLTALGMFLLESGRVDHVLHVGADEAAPMRSSAGRSVSAEQVLGRSGSRYGPTSPLTNLIASLDAGKPFAVIAKPCDLNAVHRLAATDPRVDELCVARLTLVCGGSSRLSKSQALLVEFGVDEDEITAFRYRGFGNPGPTVVETHGGRRFEKSYLDLWEDEASWQLETRCKVCPDALGEAADIAAADAWPGGAPTGEDDGFNVVICRSQIGEELLVDAVAAGYLVMDRAVAPREFDELQPHQVRKKRAVAHRYLGMADAGVTPIHTIGLRIDELGQQLTSGHAAAERAGAQRRFTDLG